MSTEPTKEERPRGLGAEVYGDYIASELAELREVKASLEQRAVTVITTSGVRVTLLFGLAAATADKGVLVVPDEGKPWLFLSLAAFALGANFPVDTTRPLWPGSKM